MAKKSICVNCKNFQGLTAIGVVHADGVRRDTGYNNTCKVAPVMKPDYVLGDYAVSEADLPQVFCKARNADGKCVDYHEIEGKTPVAFAEDIGG